MFDKLIHSKKTKMKEFAIGVATITVGVVIGVTLANIIDKKLLKM